MQNLKMKSLGDKEILVRFFGIFIGHPGDVILDPQLLRSIGNALGDLLGMGHEIFKKLS